jgi:hypothetical protein
MSVFHRPLRFRSYPGGNFSDTGGELSVLSGQYLDRRIPDKQNLIEEVAAWEAVAIQIT